MQENRESGNKHAYTCVSYFQIQLFFNKGENAIQWKKNVGIIRYPYVRKSALTYMPYHSKNYSK